MVEIRERLKDQGFEVLAFPCNQFLYQESKPEAEIKEFAQTKFGVQFPLFSKVDVNGKDAHPVYAFLRLNSSLANPQKTAAARLDWNFAKFLVDRKGQVVNFYKSRTNVSDIEPEILKLLEEPWAGESASASSSSSSSVAAAAGVAAPVAAPEVAAPAPVRAPAPEEGGDCGHCG
eukprot:GILI01003395.1.p2 GENE.GILI01003395.1~~GILI01003395.1.p2  ORF type:complete len:175 (-),score=66.85 GILI01003395.1:319-843(-)